MAKPNNLLKTCIALLLCVALLTGCGASGTKEPTDPVDPGTSDESGDQSHTADEWNQLVAQFGNHTLTSATFSYFYWASYTSFLNYYGNGTQDILDLYTPLDQQMYSEDLTWQDYFIENALMAFRQYCALNDLADAAGFTLSETAQETLDNAETQLQSTAEAMGFETAQEYLTANYGSGSTIESYKEYLHDHFVVQEYTTKLKSSYTYTDQEVEDYYDEHAEEYAESGVEKIDVPMAQLRYLMILPVDQTDESWEAIDTTFNEMLAEWDTWEDKSEEGFMAFGEKWSSEGFAQDYLEAVAPNQVGFSYFDSWVFDEPRKKGDTKTYIMESGDYLFYYLGQTDDIFWRTQAKYDMTYDAFTTFLLDTISSYTYTTHMENIIIAQSEDLYTDYANAQSLLTDDLESAE